MTSKERTTYRRILNACQAEFMNIYQFGDFSIPAARRLSMQIQQVLDLNRKRKEDWTDKYYSREDVKRILLGKDSANTANPVRDLRKAEARIEELHKAFCSVTSSVGMTDPQKALERIREISKKMLEGYVR